MSGVLAKLGAFFGRLFRRSPAPLDPSGLGGGRVLGQGMNIPAPATLVGRIERLDDEERELLRIAEEALRRGFPEQARIAYWKAARFYTAHMLPAKALAVFGQILKIAPRDLDAWIARGEANLALDRRRDAARAFADAAALAEQAGDLERARTLLLRSAELDADPDVHLRLGRLGVDAGALPPTRAPSTMQPRSASSMMSRSTSTMPSRSTSTMQPRGLVPTPADGRGSATPASARLPALSAASGTPIVQGSPVRGGTMPGGASSAHDAPRAVRAPPPADSGAALELDLGPPDVDEAPEPVELPEPVESPAARVEVPSAPSFSRPMPRFAIPSAATAYEPGFPAALFGTEHERARDTDQEGADDPLEGGATIAMEAIRDDLFDGDASDGDALDGDVDAGDTEAPTRGYDISELSDLLAATKHKIR